MKPRWILLCLCLLPTGCAAIPNSQIASQNAALVQEEEKLDYLTIGGLVRNPGTIPYRQEMTLGKALVIAGGVAPCAESDSLLVSVTKGSGILRQNILMPVDYATSTAASQIILSPNDQLFVVEFRNTLLNEANNYPRLDMIYKRIESQPEVDQFQVLGKVKNPLRRSLSNTLRDKLKQDSSAAFVNLKDVVRLAETPVIGQIDLAVFSRPQPNAVGKADVFLIPWSWSIGVNSDDRQPENLAVDTSNPQTIQDLQEAEDIFNADASTENSPAVQTGMPETWGEKIQILPTDNIVMTSTLSLPMIRNGLLRPLATAMASSMTPRVSSEVATSESTNQNRLRSRIQLAHQRIREMFSR